MLRSFRFTRVQWKVVGSFAQALLRAFRQGIHFGSNSIRAVVRRVRKPGREAATTSAASEPSDRPDQAENH